ncbi:MAG: spondin domain-containing protein [bacterium]
MRAAMLLLLVGVMLLPATASSAPALIAYRVRLFNLTSGQPFSPPVAATHQPSIRMFRVGALASLELEAIAEDGNQIPMFNLFAGDSRVTQAVDVGRPLTPIGKTVGTFTPWVTFDINARPEDKLSLATMLICTNDGFLGLDAATLPAVGRVVYALNGYDSGTEDNTEQSLDIVDPCTGLGPAILPGDPDGNDDAAVNTVPRLRIRHHPGILGNGELTPGLHGWTDPVAVVVIDRLP